MKPVATADVTIKYFRPTTKSVVVENAKVGVTKLGCSNKEELSRNISEDLYSQISPQLTGQWIIKEIVVMFIPNK